MNFWNDLLFHHTKFYCNFCGFIIFNLNKPKSSSDSDIFIVNKCLAPFPDTIFLVNEMNKHHHLDKKLQFDFLLNSLRTRKRFTPWLKASKQKNLEYVKEYYGYNNEKAKSALKILNDDQIKTIKDSLNKGGKNGN